jgi:hypothetical protein
MEGGWGGMEMRKSVYEQPGTRVSSKEGFQVSKGDSERGQKGTQQGEKKQGEAPMYISQLCALWSCVNIRMVASRTYVDNNKCQY